MKLCVFLNSGRLMRWHLWLLEDICKCSGYDAQIAFSDRKEPWPNAVRLIFQFESLLYGVRSTGASDPIGDCEIRAYPIYGQAPAVPFDVVINLTGSAKGTPKAPRVLTPLFNRSPDELNIIAALFDRKPLTLAVHDSGTAEQNFTAFPAFEDRGIISQSVNNTLSRTAELILRSLRQLPRQGGTALPLAEYANSLPSAQALQHVVGTVAGKARAMLERQLAGGERWAIGWRAASSGTLLELTEAKFQIVPDDGRRFYADPFVFKHRGMTYMFSEEFPFATKKGMISVSSMLPNGRWSQPVSIIEENHHLSYPFVFEHCGNIWMVPESGQNMSVDLYLAVDFPLKWVKHCILLDGIDAYDATLHARADGWWLFATTRHRQSATSDNLELFHAERLTGPWQSHELNPVMIDARHSRSAGALFIKEGRTLRPAQDCSMMYGGAVSLCCITAMGLDRYEQRVTGRLHASEFGVHTYNFSTEFEVVDVFGYVSGIEHAEIHFSSSTPFRCDAVIGQDA